MIFEVRDGIAVPLLAGKQHGEGQVLRWRVGLEGQADHEGVLGVRHHGLVAGEPVGVAHPFDPQRRVGGGVRVGASDRDVDALVHRVGGCAERGAVLALHDLLGT
ncbi:MAG: hypothetical protein U5K81_14950 [Trueperaceae bacterium]|nr:hypothetical protein [Trueperaceae bacterium]